MVLPPDSCVEVDAHPKALSVPDHLRQHRLYSELSCTG